MGVAHGPALLLVAGAAVGLAGAVAGLLEEVEVVAAGPGADALPQRTGVSRMDAGERLPLASGRVAAATLTGSAAHAWLAEAARVLRPAGRLVLSPIPADAEARLAGARCRVMARDGATLVALRE
jgi:hypothetical protein